MKRITLIGLGVGALHIFSGCVQPSFNSNNKMMVFVEGEPYYVPKNANHMLKTLNTIDANEINKMGGSCKKGDVFWVAYTAKSLLTENGRSHEEIKKAYINAHKKGLSGCASPLSNQEYEDRLNQKKY